MGFGRGDSGGGGRWEEEMGFLLWVGVVVWAGKEGMGRGFLLWVGVVVWAGKGGMGRGKEAMIKGGCKCLESGVRVLL